jgi:hypothetical protein
LLLVGVAPYNKPFNKGSSLSVWWQTLAQEAEMLAIVALLLLAMVPHAPDIERIISLMG